MYVASGVLYFCSFLCSMVEGGMRVALSVYMYVRSGSSWPGLSLLGSLANITFVG